LTSIESVLILASTSIEPRRIAMSAAENEALVRHLYTEVGNGNPAPLVEHLADDVEWTIIGSTPLSGVYRGREEVVTKLFAGLRAALQAPVRFTFDRFIAAGDQVVMEAHGHAATIDGRPYENRYCVIVDVVDGRLQRVIDYVDTELVTSVLFAGAA
jgi:ketosteroid isomerase-like protein